MMSKSETRAAEARSEWVNENPPERFLAGQIMTLGFKAVRLPNTPAVTAPLVTPVSYAAQHYQSHPNL
jgi:hypothetical protein